MELTQVGDDEYEEFFDHEKAKESLGGLEAAKMAIKFLDQVLWQPCLVAPERALAFLQSSL